MPERPRNHRCVDAHDALGQQLFRRIRCVALDEHAGQDGHSGQRHNKRCEQGVGDNERKREKELTDDAADEAQGRKNGDGRQRRDCDGHSDFPRAGVGRLQPVIAVLDVSIDVLHDDDGVIDDATRRDGKAAKRDEVQAHALQVHNDNGDEEA